MHDFELEPTTEEKMALIQSEISKNGKRPDFTNFLLMFKKNNFKAFPFFIEIKSFLKKNKLEKNLILIYMIKMELAEKLLFEGANLAEIKCQTNIPDELLIILIQKNYSKIPQEIIELKIIHYRLMSIVKNMHRFYMKILLEHTPKEKKDFIETFYQIILDITSDYPSEFKYFDLYKNVLIKGTYENI